STDRQRWFDSLTAQTRLAVFFEAPHRISRTLRELVDRLGGDRVIGVARELTKAHEELVIRPINAVLASLDEPRGEFTVLLPPQASASRRGASDLDVASLEQELGLITKNGRVSRRDGLKELSRKHGVRVNELYRLLQHAD